MSEKMSREIHLKRRPLDLPREGDLELVAVPIPQPGEGEMLVRNIYMSVDPYMRGRMRDGPSYVPPFRLDHPLDGGCVGQVVRSNGGTFQAGDYVLGRRGWREYFVSGGSDLTRIDPSVAPIQAYLGALGMPGLTAYVGLLDIGRPQAGNTVFVSAAAGAVGSVACQIAKIQGCRVVGSAGSDDKVRWLLDRAGVDAAFNYKTVDGLSAQLARDCPGGIDVYFDNVGGAHLDAALEQMNPFGRLVLCGMIAQYNAAEPPPGPRNLFKAVAKRLLLKGFIVSDHADRQPAFQADMARWVAEGRITWQETVVEGIERAPQAFLGLFSGDNVGKMLVKIGPDPAVG
jgi:NADPH-dependent curcumin reductase CurA